MKRNVENDKPSVTIKPSRAVRPIRPKGQGCEHNYKMLTNNLEVTVLNSGPKDRHWVEGLVLFYCTKCLGMERRMIQCD